MKPQNLLTLTIAGALACGASHQGGLNSFRVENHTGQTPEYSVEVQETFYGMCCAERTIILRERPAGLFQNPNHVDYVRAVDRNCKGTIDDLYFRGASFPFRSIDEGFLKLQILAAYDEILWKVK